MKTLRIEFNSISASGENTTETRPSTLSACSDALQFVKTKISIQVGTGISPFEAVYVKAELIISESELVVHVYKQK